MRYLLLLSLLFAACTNSEVISEESYFDTGEFVAKEIEKLNASNLKGAEKTITLGGKTESNTLASVDFTQELSVFSDSNINRPALYGKYEIVDTLLGTQQQTIYRAKEKDLNVQSLSITKTGETITEIAVEKRSDSYIYDSYQSLQYFPQKGYKISTRQKTITIPEMDYTVETVYQ